MLCQSFDKAQKQILNAADESDSIMLERISVGEAQGLGKMMQENSTVHIHIYCDHWDELSFTSFLMQLSHEVQTLNLSGNKIPKEERQSLITFLKTHNTISKLNLENTNFDAAFCAQIKAAVRGKNIQCIFPTNLSTHPDSFVANITQGLAATRLEEDVVDVDMEPECLAPNV